MKSEITNPFDGRNPDEVWKELKSKSMPISREEFMTDMILLQLKEIYQKGNLNSVHGYLKRNKIQYTQDVVNFGLDNKSNRSEKQQWLDESMRLTKSLRTHLYSIGIKSRKTGYGYNKLRGSEIKITIWTKY